MGWRVWTVFAALGVIWGLPYFFIKLAVQEVAPIMLAFCRVALAAAVHAFVAATPSLLALVQADDLAGETVGVNLPGTDRERPNWRRRLDVDVATLCQTPLARAILAAMHARRAGPLPS